MASDLDKHSQSTRQSLALWIISVLILWSVAHALNRWVLMMDERTPALRFVWWTSAKLVTWLLPTWILLRSCGSASARWLGLTTRRGLGVATVCGRWCGWMRPLPKARLFRLHMHCLFA